MRKLYVIPIIHTSADMGSIASALNERGEAKVTREIWRRQQETVSAFWDAIGKFLEGLDVSGFKVYQDGMVANGAVGLRIVREGINQGSKNFQIIGGLLERGAVLVKTESLPLAKQEYDHIIRIVRSKALKREIATLRYKFIKDRLLRQRDEFIAGKINKTLAEGEAGLLFIGACHNVLARLAGDIDTIPVKQIENVRKYHKLIVSGRVNDERIEQLASYLTLPVPDTLLAQSLHLDE